MRLTPSLHGQVQLDRTEQFKKWQRTQNRHFSRADTRGQQERDKMSGNANQTRDTTSPPSGPNDKKPQNLTRVDDDVEDGNLRAAVGMEIGAAVMENGV